jgi:hypothetical protein
MSSMMNVAQRTDVTFKRPEYTGMLAKWEKCRDVTSGEELVKAKGETYLPRNTGWDSERYESFKKRALFYNASMRTVQGLQGLAFRKPPNLEYGEREDIKRHLEDITMSGVDATSFAQRVIVDLLKTGRVIVLLDMPEEESPEQRPYWVFYQTEALINWRVTRWQGKMLLTRAVLCEQLEKEDGEFGVSYITQYRELVLVQEGGAWRYEVNLWQKVDARTNVFAIVKTVHPKRRGAPLNFLPIIVQGIEGIDMRIDDPPLLDLVNVNLSHYVSSADLEHGRHWTALPTPVVMGAASTNKNEPLVIGSTSAWSLDKGGDAKMLEFTGVGLGELRMALEHKERMMAVLGARLLEDKPTAGQREAAETVRLRHSGENATMKSLVIAASAGLTRALRYHLWWFGATDVIDDPKITFGLNQDFFEEKLSPQEIDALMKLWQAGGLSFPTLYHNLVRGELARPGITDAQEKELIDGETEERVKQMAAVTAATTPQEPEDDEDDEEDEE